MTAKFTTSTNKKTETQGRGVSVFAGGQCLSSMFLEHSTNQKSHRLSQLKGSEEKASLRLVLREWSRSDRRPAGKEIALQVSRTKVFK